MAVGLIKCGHKKTAIISAYMDIKLEATPQYLKDAIAFCKLRGYSIILTADTNSHNKLWGNQNNRRGLNWGTFIEDEDLLLHNNGRIPTYESQLGKSIINITLNYNLKWKLSQWRVLRSYNGTDHNTIHFKLEQAMIHIPEYRNYDKANWETFKHELSKFTIPIPSEMTECKLDKMVSKLNIGLTKALNKACPLTKPKMVDSNNAWWTPQLQAMRKNVSKLYDSHKNGRKNLALHMYYKRKQKEYRQKCKKAQKQQVKYENETVSNEEAMAKKIQHLTSNLKPQVTTLTKDDGGSTEVGEETCKELMDKHFPTHIKRKDNEYSYNKISTTCLLYTSPSPRDRQKSRMPSSA